MQEFLEALMKATITIPAIEMVLIIAILIICLLMRMPRAGLVTAYLFCYYWGWNFFQSQDPIALIAYLGLGALIPLLAVIGMLSAAE